MPQAIEHPRITAVVPVLVPLLLLQLLLLLSGAAETFAESPATREQRPHKLLFVAELCRHGDRTPLGEAPTDVLPVSRWPEGIGQLTTIGQRAHYDLGQRLRKRYVVDLAFLPGSYSRDALYVRSTDIDRTLMSATSQLMGLYPADNASSTYDVREKFGHPPRHASAAGLPNGVQPIPVHTVSTAHDPMLLPGANCARHAQLASEKLASDEFSNKVRDSRAFLDQLAALAGMPKDNEPFTMHQAARVWDTWFCCMSHDVPLPPGVTPDIVNKAGDLANWLLDLSNRGQEVRRLRAGLTLNAVREYMLQTAAAAVRASTDSTGDGTDSNIIKAKKFVLFSAHDTTVAATLAAMGVFDGKYPPYNSTLIWELWQNTSSPSSSDAQQHATRPSIITFVRVLYNDVPLTLPGCDSPDCEFGTYVRATKDVTIFGGDAQRETECLVGPKRYLALVGQTLFGRRRSDDGDRNEGAATLGTSTSSGAATGGGWAVLPTLAWVAVVAAVVAAAAVAFVRVRRHYGYYGYVNPAEDGDGHLAGVDSDKNVGSRQQVDRIANQRILM